MIRSMSATLVAVVLAMIIVTSPQSSDAKDRRCQPRCCPQSVCVQPQPACCQPTATCCQPQASSLLQAKATRGPICPLMAMLDWGDGTCSFMAVDCPFDPAMLDADCALTACFCDPACATTSCVAAEFVLSKSRKHASHAHHHKLKPSNKKRDKHQPPSLQNEGDPAANPTKIRIQKIGESQIAKFANGTKFVELWAFHVAANIKGNVQREVFGVGRQLNEKKLTQQEKDSAIDVTANLTVHSVNKFVISIDNNANLNAEHYQVVLAENAK